ncbi:MAG TPA: hypothetical protein VHY35_23460 [Stellaceae bacterium]|nr:hypothetical protein [Stellaceae bacterium]
MSDAANDELGAAITAPKPADPTAAPWAYLGPIHYLIRREIEFIVYLDDDLALEWSTNDDEHKIKDQTKFNQLISESAVLETTPCDRFERQVIRDFRRLVGEGVVLALDNDYVGAAKVLQSARFFIVARSEEKSRCWYLTSSIVASAPFALIVTVLWAWRQTLAQVLGEGAFWLILTTSAGAIGALFSVILRSGKM